MVRSAFGQFVAGLSAIGTAWILVLMALICADVLGRDLFSAPIPGVPEMVAFSIVGIVFLQLAQTLREGGLTRSDVLLSRLTGRWPRLGHALECIFSLVGATLFFLIARTTWPALARAYQEGDFYGNIGVIQLPIWWLKAVVILGAATMAVQFLIVAWHSARVVVGAPAPEAAAPVAE